MKQGVNLDKETNKRLSEITATTKALSQEKQKLNREINNTIKANTAASKSYDSLTAANAKLSARLRALQDPLGANKKEFTALAGQINSNTDKLKEMDAAMGRHQRNVGNYSGAIKGAFSQMGLLLERDSDSIERNGCPQGRYGIQCRRCHKVQDSD